MQKRLFVKTREILLTIGFLIIGSSCLFGASSILTWVKDMYNQISLKPQERGMMMTFPEGIVSIDGRYYEPHPAPMSWVVKEMKPATATTNTTRATPESILNGKKVFNIICAACHGQNGMSGTPVMLKGMPAPPIKLMSPGFTDGYIYRKIKFGGIVMPPFGYATSEKERWDIVNYIRVLEKSK